MRLKRYLWFHAAFLLFVAFFAVYAYVMITVFENRVPHCFLHDVAHLYCPFCGGTRAFLACLRFDVHSALIFHPAVIAWGMLFLALDVRALVLIVKGERKPLFPEWLLAFSVWYFGAFFALRNTLALFGVDPMGDIAPFWASRITPVWAVLASFLLCLLTALGCRAILPSKRGNDLGTVLCFAVLLVPFAAILYSPWVLLLWLPLLVGVALWQYRRTRPLSLTVLKYGETTIPERMAFADRKGCQDPVEISLLLYLIETRGRRILVDAGCDVMRGYDVKHQVSPAEILKRYGLLPTDITDLVLTHAHNDHAGAAHYFTNATVHIARDEVEYATQKGFLPAGLTVKPFRSRRRIVGVAARVWGGHSKGSSIVTFRHGGKSYVIAGDECYSKRCLSEGRPTGSSYNKERSLAFVRLFGGSTHTVLLSHDPDVLPGQNGFLKII